MRRASVRIPCTTPIPLSDLAVVISRLNFLAADSRFSTVLRNTSGEGLADLMRQRELAHFLFMGLEKSSFCKVNLLLNILGKRPDGFHELETIMQPVPVF